MTRINTNVGSLIAQTNLAKSHAQLQTALNRLSTGLRINTGKDDPAGLIASEVLRSDIVSVQRGISNSQLANQLISTADSALGQVSSLLNDIRGLVSEAANTGAFERRSDCGQSAAGRLFAGSHRPHLANHLVPRPPSAGRQLGLYYWQRRQCNGKCVRHVWRNRRCKCQRHGCKPADNLRGECGSRQQRRRSGGQRRQCHRRHFQRWNTHHHPQRRSNGRRYCHSN